MLTMRASTVVVLFVLSGCGSHPEVSPQKEGLVWEYKDLVEYLKSRGMETKQNKVTVGSVPGIQLIFPSGERNIIVVRRQTPEAAADDADARGSSYAWGRFVFFWQEGTYDRSPLPNIQGVLRGGHDPR
jgi:hypothetical protein